MKIKAIILFPAILFASVQLFAQYREGYIITNSGDTINGYLNFEGSSINCNQCTFISMPDSIKHTFIPGEIQAFRFNGSKYYITATVNENGNQRKVFLEWLVKGKASMLAYISPGMKSRYFILPENDTLTELINTVKTVIAKDVKTTNTQKVEYLHSGNEYIGTLLYYMRDCPSISGRIQTTALSGGSLIKIAKEYQAKTCPGQDCEFFEDRQRGIKIEGGFSFGYILSQLRLNNGLAENSPRVGANGFGVALNMYNLPVLPPKFSFSIRMDFYNLTYKYDTILYYVHDNRICKVTFLRIPFQLNYYFSYGKFSPYIALGASANLRFGYTEYDDYLPRIVRNNLWEHAVMKTIQPGLRGGAGFRYKLNDKIDICIHADYEHDFGFYGSYVNEKAYLNNIIAGFTAYYRIN